MQEIEEKSSRSELRAIVREQLRLLLEDRNWEGVKTLLLPVQPVDIVKDANSSVEGVLYRLPWRLSDRLDEREEVKIDPGKQVHIGGYRPEMIDVHSQGKDYQNVRTYMVINKLTQELAPNDWYFNVVLRGAVTCGLTQEYCWQLFNHMYNLQRQQVNYQNS